MAKQMLYRDQLHWSIQTPIEEHKVLKQVLRYVTEEW